MKCTFFPVAFKTRVVKECHSQFDTFNYLVDKCRRVEIRLMSTVLT